MRRLSVTPGFVASACLLAWYQWEICLWFLLALAIHEAGHLLALALARVGVRRITLAAGGAKIQTAAMTYRQEWICAAAGPAASILFAGLLLRLCPTFSLISLGLAAINLLPLYPMDGGRALRAILLRRLPPEQVNAILRLCVWVTCSALMLGACWLTGQYQAGLWPIFLALVLLCRAGEAAEVL